MATHQQRGTFRRDRHGPKVAPPPEARPSVKPPRSLLASLGPAGKQFIRDCWRDYEFSLGEVHVLRVAASCLDAEAAARDAGNVPGTATARRQFLTALTRIGFPPADRR